MKTNPADYVPMTRFAGNGLTRSCGRCLKHKPYTASVCTEAAKWGWTKRWKAICPGCNAELLAKAGG